MHIVFVTLFCQHPWHCSFFMSAGTLAQIIGSWWINVSSRKNDTRRLYYCRSWWINVSSHQCIISSMHHLIDVSSHHRRRRCGLLLEQADEAVGDGAVAHTRVVSLAAAHLGGLQRRRARRARRAHRRRRRRLVLENAPSECVNWPNFGHISVDFR